jgi:hypothetical protein
MFLNIITPCSRPQNLKAISESINIPKENYRWIVVFDMDLFPENCVLPTNAECYCHRNENSRFGNSQRNFALDLVEEGHVYVNDDDTVIHPELWESIKNSTEDMITFMQSHKDGSIRLTGDTIAVSRIDSHNFIVSYEAIKGARWDVGLHHADGVFAEICNQNANTKKYIPQILSVYNQLRQDT